MIFNSLKNQSTDKSNTRKLNKQDISGWLFVSVAVLLITIFVVYPIISAFLLSFKSPNGATYTFSGITNIKRMLSDSLFYKSLGNTLLFLVIQVPIMLFIALVLASLMNSDKIKFKGIFRTAIFLPCVTSLVAYSVLFKMMFSGDGIINRTLLSLHIINDPILFLNSTFWAKVIIIVALIWRWTGYNMMFYLSGLQTIPKEVYEASSIDGASKIKQFLFITVPQLKPIILFTAITSTIGTLQLFDEPMNITKGGPSNSTVTISQYIYNQSFVFNPNFGYAAMLSFAIVVIVVILSVIQFKVAGEE